MVVALFHDFLRSRKAVQHAPQRMEYHPGSRRTRGPRLQSNKWTTRDRQSSNPQERAPKKRIVACQTEVSQAQVALAKVQSKLQFEKQGFSRWRGTIGGQFRPRVCRVASMSVRVTAREHGFACAIAVRSRRRARTQTSQKFGNVFSRIGPSEPCRRGPWSRVGQSMPLMGNVSLRMETLIDNAEASLRLNRFNLLSG